MIIYIPPIVLTITMRMINEFGIFDPISFVEHVLWVSIFRFTLKHTLLNFRCLETGLGISILQVAASRRQPMQCMGKLFDDKWVSFHVGDKKYLHSKFLVSCLPLTTFRMYITFEDSRKLAP